MNSWFLKMLITDETKSIIMMSFYFYYFQKFNVERFAHFLDQWWRCGRTHFPLNLQLVTTQQY